MWNEEDRNTREWNCGGFGILTENFDLKDTSMNEKWHPLVPLESWSIPNIDFSTWLEKVVRRKKNHRIWQSLYPLFWLVRFGVPPPVPTPFNSCGWPRLWALPSHGNLRFGIEGRMKEGRCCLRTTLISRVLYWHAMTCSPGFLESSQKTYNWSAPTVVRMWATGLTNSNNVTGKVTAHFVTQGCLSPFTQTDTSLGQVSTSFEITPHWHQDL